MRPYKQINEALIAKNFGATTAYTLEEIKERLDLSKKLNNETLLQALDKYCYIYAKGSKYVLQAKVEMSYIDCVRYKILADMGTFKDKYYTYNALSKVLYGKGFDQLPISARPQYYGGLKKCYKQDAAKIINGYNLCKILTEDVRYLRNSKNDTISQKYLIERYDGTMRHSTEEEKTKISGVMRSFSWGTGTSAKYKQIVKEINANILSEGEYYKGAIFNFNLSPIIPTLSVEDIDKRIKSHVYHRFIKAYERDGQYDPHVKQVINRWARYQFNMGPDLSFAKDIKYNN